VRTRPNLFQHRGTAPRSLPRLGLPFCNAALLTRCGVFSPRERGITDYQGLPRCAERALRVGSTISGLAPRWGLSDRDLAALTGGGSHDWSARGWAAGKPPPDELQRKPRDQRSHLAWAERAADHRTAWSNCPCWWGITSCSPETLRSLGVPPRKWAHRQEGSTFDWGASRQRGTPSRTPPSKRSIRREGPSLRLGVIAKPAGSWSTGTRPSNIERTSNGRFSGPIPKRLFDRPGTTWSNWAATAEVDGVRLPLDGFAGTRSPAPRQVSSASGAKLHRPTSRRAASARGYEGGRHGDAAEGPVDSSPSFRSKPCPVLTTPSRLPQPKRRLGGSNSSS